MAKAKNETVDWEMDWTDVAEEPASQEEVRPQAEATQEMHPVAKVGPPPPDAKAGVLPTASQFHPEFRSEREAAVHLESTPNQGGIPTTRAIKPVQQRQEILLAKKPKGIVQREAREHNGTAPEAQFPSQQAQPLPLPSTAQVKAKTLPTRCKEQTSATEAKRFDPVTARINQPSPPPKKTEVPQMSKRLVEKPEPTGRASSAEKIVRKPPSGISSIFKRDESTDSPEPTPVEDSQEIPAAPAISHPPTPQSTGRAKLGPAFQSPARGEDGPA